MNRLLRYSFLLLMTVVGRTGAFADDIWSEDFSSYAKNAVPSGGTYSYACVGNGTKIYNENLAGGTAPELLVGKNGGSFSATIPLGGVSGELTLTYNTNKSDLSVSVDGGTLGTRTASEKTYTYPVTVASGTTELTIVFTMSSSQNARLDDIKLYKGETEPTLQSPGLKWSKATATVHLDAEDAKYPTLTNPYDLPVTYSSSDINVASISASGVITLFAAGTTDISASFAGDETYEAQTVQYKLTVEEWGKFTKATSIVSGRRYLVVADVEGQLKAAKLITAKNYGTPGAQNITEEDGIVEANVVNALTVTETEDGYTFQMSDGRYWYKTAKSSGEPYNNFNVSDNPPSGQYFSIEFQEDGTALMKDNLYGTFLQYKSGFVSYTEEQEDAVLPMLYAEVPEVPTAENTTDFTQLIYDALPADLKENISDLEIYDKRTGTTIAVSGSGDEEAPNRYVQTSNGSVLLELNGGTMTFKALEGRSVKKITFDYEEWDAGNSAALPVAAAQRRADGEDNGDVEVGEGGDEPAETGFVINEEKKTAVWQGSADVLVVTINGKTLLKSIAIEIGEKIGEKVVLDLPTGKDIAEEVMNIYAQNPYVGSITLNLAKDGKYTANKPIYISKPFILNGAEGAEVDASGNNGPLIQLAEVPELGLNAAGAYEISEVTLKDVKISGVKNRLFFAARQKYLLKKLSVENSVIHIDGFAPAAIFDFYYGGNTEELSIVNSTLWANPANTMLGGLLNTQSGQDVEELGGSSQKIVIKNSTLYSIAYGKAPVLLRNYGQDWMSFEVTDNVIVNSGEKGQFLLGLNTGTKGASTWTVSGNAFSFDGEDTGAAETLSAAIADAAIAGEVLFADVENGDFTLAADCEANKQKVGDPRWLVEYVPTTVGVVKEATAAEGEWYTLQGVRVDKPAKGIYIHNGRKVVKQ